MSLTVLEVLENARYNLEGTMQFQREIGLQQLCNALDAITKGGLELDDDFPESEKI